MSKPFFFSLSLLLFFLLFSCKTKVPPASSSQAVILTDTAAALPSSGSSLGDSLDCRVMVDFISTGGGINSHARQLLEHYQIQFNLETNLPVRPRRVPRGREGEVEYCYTLAGFSEAEQKAFVAGLRETLDNQALVFIKEYGKQSLQRNN